VAWPLFGLTTALLIMAVALVLLAAFSATHLLLFGASRITGKLAAYCPDAGNTSKSQKGRIARWVLSRAVDQIRAPDAHPMACYSPVICEADGEGRRPAGRPARRLTRFAAVAMGQPPSPGTECSGLDCPIRSRRPSTAR
jgi:hypothetical protein